MRQVECIVTVLDTDMDMLTEHGKCLRQVAVFFMQLIEALAGRNTLLAPILEWVGATAGDIDIHMLRNVD